MPILLVFALTAACVPVKWHRPLLGGGESTAIGFAVGAVTLSLVIAFLLRTWVVRTLHRDPGRKFEVANVYGWVRRLMFFANIGLVALAILVFGWGWFVQQTLIVFDPAHGRMVLAPFAELAVPLPYFIILFGAWTIYFDAERALHRTTLLGPTERAFWGRVGYFFHHLRQFLLLVMLPVMLLVIQQTLSRFAPEMTATNWYRLSWIALILILLVMMPLVIKPLLGLQSMPPGPIRDRLEALGKRLHFRCTDFLLWPTHGAVANAMIVGLLPRARYVIFTDRLLEDLRPEELDAVFGHEVGHAKHGHIWLYAVFLLLSMTVLAASLLFLEQWLIGMGVELSETAKDWIALPPVILIASYIFLVWGFLSRRCERQADVYGCRAVSCDNPNCAGHDENTRYPERAGGLCPTGIHTFVRALEQVNSINGHAAEEERQHSKLGAMVKGFFAWLKHWMHSTTPRRVGFLRSLIGDTAKERRFQRAVTILRWVLILGLLAALYVLGEAVGWQKLAQEL